MKTRFFFPVVAMIAFATVTNAAAFKLGGNESGVEVASVEKVDARAGVETSVCGAGQKGLTSVLACGAEMDARAGAETSVLGTRLSGLASVFTSGAEMDTKAGAEVAKRMDVGAKTSVCGERQKGIMAGFECGAETSVQVAGGMDGRIEI